MKDFTAPWMRDESAIAVSGALESAGFKALMVGGAVRNPLLGISVTDLDMATDALPSEVVYLARAAGLRAVPTGIDHGTVTVIGPGEPIEVTTLRKDVATDGRHAVVTFGTSVGEDAARRDFTMNALYADMRGTIQDPLGGLPDLQRRIVRFVGNSAERVEEDFLRILRFFRFIAIYGDPEQGIEPEGLAACAALAEGLETISAERIGAEVLKTLSAKAPGAAVAAMAQCGVLRVILPGASVDALLRLGAISGTTDPILRLAALGGCDVPNRLRLSRAQAKRLKSLTDAATSMQGAAELGYRLGSANALDVLCLRAALLEIPFDPTWHASLATGDLAVFPLRSIDLNDEFSGPSLGKALQWAETSWIESGFSETKDALIKALKRGQ